MWKLVTCIFLSQMFLCAKAQNIDEKFEEEFVSMNRTKKNQTDCFFTLTGLSQSIDMGKFNNLTQNCTWLIEPHLKKGTPQIRLFFHSLFLHKDDVLSIYKDLTDIGNESLRISDPIHAQNGSVTVITGLQSLVITINGTNIGFLRKFSGIYHTDDVLPLTPDVHILHSPIFVELNGTSPDITYSYSQSLPDTQTPTFVFEEFKMNSSQVSVTGGSVKGPYTNDPKMDLFPTENPMKLEVKMKEGSKDYFRLRLHMVDIGCSRFYEIKDSEATGYPLESPPQVLNNGSMVYECRWIFKAADSSKILGITFENLHFDSILDVISINDGASELSPPLLQITSSNSNYTKSQVLRTNGSDMWIAFKPVTYATKLSANIKVHGQGGHRIGNGTISVVSPTDGNDTVFLLEVKETEVVLLNFTAYSFTFPATLSIYDGFDRSNLLTTLHGNVWYPVLSTSSKMMIIATNFKIGSFTADFKGVSSDCIHMSTASNENYILSGNCNATCFWVVPPQDRPNSMLLLNLQFISLGHEDTILIYQLDAAKTNIGTISANVTHVPQVALAPTLGALVEINRGPCQKENNIVVVGQSSYVPACGKDMHLLPVTKFQITTPLYPDTYPVFSNCRWKLSATKGNLVHLAFHSLKLAANHCVKVLNVTGNNTFQYVGSQLPDDLFLSEESVVEFDSSNCGSKKIANSLVSSEGFVLNGTVADCGAVLKGKTSGEFTVPANRTLCIWKVDVSKTNADANDDVNIISYSVSKKDDKENYALDVYNGASVRESLILNNSNAEIWSRTSSLIFIYRRIDESKPSSILSIKYSTISCNDSMQCDNKICLHPDWRCNGINDCGDFSDERNCISVPAPPDIKPDGYTPLAFWLTIFLMLAFGAMLGIGLPHLYQKYQNGQYRRFGDISVIE